MSDTDVEPGLRERKRLAAMRHVQAVALDLFDAEGFATVTIERIAADADVSPSSVYRYFGTKEQIVLWDVQQPIWSSHIPADLGGLAPLEAIRAVVDRLTTAAPSRDLVHLRRRVRLIMEEPSIEASSALEAYDAAEVLCTAVAEGLGRDHGDLDVQLFAHAVVGAIVGGYHHWYESDFSTPLPEIMNRVFASFESGFGISR